MNEQHNIQESDITLEPQSQRIIREHFESLSTQLSRYREALVSAKELGSKIEGLLRTMQDGDLTLQEVWGLAMQAELTQRDALSQINEALEEKK